MQNRFYELTNKVLRTDGGQQIEIYKDLIRSFLNFESAIKNNDDKSIQMQFNQGIELAIELVNASGPKISHEEWDQLTNNIQLLIESNNLTANKLMGKRLDTIKYSTCVAILDKTIKDLDEISKNNLGNNANNSVAINATRSTKAFEKNYIKIRVYFLNFF